MNNVISFDQENKINSLDLLSQINAFRLETGEKAIRNNDFIKRVYDELDFYEKFVKPIRTSGDSGRPKEYCMLDKDQCLLIGMRESKVVRRKVLGWIKKLTDEQEAKPALPKTYLEALKELVVKEEENQKLQLKVKEDAPKVESYERLSDSKGSLTYTDSAKELGIKPRVFINWLIDTKYITPKRLPYQRFIDQGLFECTCAAYNGYTRQQGRLTGKGLNYFSKKYDF